MDLETALNYFLTPDNRHQDNLRGDLIAAVQEAARRRKEGPEATAVIVKALHEQLGMTYMEIEAISVHPMTGVKISRATAARLVAGQGS